MATRFIADLEVKGVGKNVTHFIRNVLDGRMVVKDEFTFKMLSNSRFMSLRGVGRSFVDTNELTFVYPNEGKEMVAYIPMQSTDGFSDVETYRLLSKEYGVELIGKSYCIYLGLISNMHVEKGTVISSELSSYDPYVNIDTTEEYEWDVMIETSSYNPFENKRICGKLDEFDELVLSDVDSIYSWDVMLE